MSITMDNNMVEKSTTHVSQEKVHLFQSLMKSSENKYVAVLSNNSIDRDGEIMSSKALQKVCGDTEGKTAILVDHENKIENMIGEWTNKRIEEVDGYTALVAEPKFYESNPKAQMIKGMLDEGAQCGISIGAIVKDKTTEKINGKSTTVYTDLELLEASFVAIPSNRHGAAMAVAKKFEQKLYEETQMTEEKQYSEKEYTELLDAKNSVEAELSKAQEKIESLEKEAEQPDEEVVAEPTEEVVDAPEKSVVTDLAKSVEDLSAENKAIKEELEKLKKAPNLKAKFDTPEGQENTQKMKDGELPILRR